MKIVLASGSTTRADLFRAAGISFEVDRPRLDEDAIKESLLAEGAPPRDIADALAEAKARKIAGRHPGAVVLGCDQVLDLDGDLLSKPADPADAEAQILRLSGRRHRLHSAVVAYEDGEPVWRHVSLSRLTMRQLTNDYVKSYIGRNWPAIGSSVGAYRLEEEGMRLFLSVEGDAFSVQGIPMLPLLSWMIERGYLPA